MGNYKETIRRLMILFLMSQIVIIFGLAGEGHFDYIRSVLGTTALWIVYTYCEVRCRIYMNNYVRVLVVITLLCDGFFGYYLNFYETSFIFDKILHVFGTYAFSLFSYILIVQLLRQPVNRLFKFILIVCLGLSLGTFYEILEFLTDTFSHPALVSQPSLLDTDLDLIGDVIGAVIAGLHGSYATFMDQNF
jgi:VanZ family protein